MPFPLMGSRFSPDKESYKLSPSDLFTTPVGNPGIVPVLPHGFGSFKRLLWDLEVHQLYGKVLPLVRRDSWGLVSTFYLVGGMLIATSKEVPALMVVKGCFTPQQAMDLIKAEDFEPVLRCGSEASFGFNFYDDLECWKSERKRLGRNRAEELRIRGDSVHDDWIVLVKGKEGDDGLRAYHQFLQSPNLSEEVGSEFNRLSESDGDSELDRVRRTSLQCLIHVYAYSIFLNGFQQTASTQTFLVTLCIHTPQCMHPAIRRTLHHQSLPSVYPVIFALSNQTGRRRCPPCV